VIFLHEQQFGFQIKAEKLLCYGTLNQNTDCFFFASGCCWSEFVKH